MPHPAHAFTNYLARAREGLHLTNRRGMLKAALSGVAGLSLPELLRSRALANPNDKSQQKSCILLWMAGGPSHIDTWDSKPNRPENNRGPFGVTQTKLPGVVICEHLPKQAAMLDKFTIIRSVDAQNSNHEPNKVFQTGNSRAEFRTNPESEKYPALASIIAKERGANHPSVPPYVAFMKSQTHLAFAGYLGKRYDPFIANKAVRLPVYNEVGKDSGRLAGGEMFQFGAGLTSDRMHDRSRLLADFDRLRANLDKNGIDQDGSMSALNHYQHQAVDMLLGGRAQEAFDLTREPEETKTRYGKHLWCQQALVARRLVEAGTAFVTLDLSYHGASGTWDTHGDNIPPYGGIKKGLGPLLPLFDHLVTTLVSDLDQRGLLENTLVIAMGEFGRTPNMGTQDSTDGRDHWPSVMSMCLAGGGLRHGQVIGASEKDGSTIRERPVTPGDLAATLFRYFGVSQDTYYTDNQGRPRLVIENDGKPISELF